MKLEERMEEEKREDEEEEEEEEVDSRVPVSLGLQSVTITLHPVT